MDELAQQAMTTLDAKISSIVPASVPAGITRAISVIPVSIQPTGLGGYIGEQDIPAASIYGRRIQARVNITLEGGQDHNARAHIDQVARQFLLQDRRDLRKNGIFWIKPDEMNAREARFSLLFEYEHHPAESEGVIDTLDLQLETNDTPYNVRFVWDMATSALVGADSPLADFLVSDDPDLNAGSPVSQWSFNAAAARIEQNAAVRGGALTTAQTRKAGAQLLWQPGQAPLSLENFIAIQEFESASNDGIGMVFHRTDSDNFLFFLASEHHRYHLFGRKKAGEYSFIGNINTNAGFSLNTRHTLRISSVDGKLSAVMDGQQTLVADVGETLPAGEIGFLTHGNNRARFYRARVMDLI